MSKTETARLHIFDHYIVNLMRGTLREPHQHAAYQLTVSLDGRPHRVGNDPSTLRPGLIHLVRSNASHAFDGSAGEQILFWLAPETAIARRLERSYLGEDAIAALPEHCMAALPIDELRDALHDGISARGIAQLTEALLDALSESTSRPPEAVHPAVRKAVRVIRALETKAISAEELASRVGLSKGRLLHVFKEHMGVALRPYLQWVRCVDLMVLLAKGWSPTDAALAAGFTDAAHANRVLKRYLALSPSMLVANTDMEVRLHLAEMLG